MTAIVYNPTGISGANNPDGNILANELAGKQGEQLVSELHGKWYSANVRRNVFSFVSDYVSLTNLGQGGISTNGMTSVFTLFNPASSGVNAEVISTSYGHDNATTVVGVVGWYSMLPTATQSSTAVVPVLATKATAGSTYFSGRVGDAPGGVIVPYTSVTFTTTGGGLITQKVDTVCTIGAATDTNTTAVDKQHDGRLILPPGQFIMLGTTGAVMPSSHLQVVWAEWPFA